MSSYQRGALRRFRLRLGASHRSTEAEVTYEFRRAEPCGRVNGHAGPKACSRPSRSVWPAVARDRDPGVASLRAGPMVTTSKRLTTEGIYDDANDGKWRSINKLPIDDRPWHLCAADIYATSFRRGPVDRV